MAMASLLSVAKVLGSVSHCGEGEVTLMLLPLYFLGKQQKLLDFSRHEFYMSNAFNARETETRDDFCCSYLPVKYDGATREFKVLMTQWSFHSSN